MYHFKTENSNTYFIHKITRNEKIMKRNTKIKNSLISKLCNLTPLNVLGLIYSMKCEGNVTYLFLISIVNNGFACHQILLLTAATGLCHHDG
jgi:hypothetical protein